MKIKFQFFFLTDSSHIVRFKRTDAGDDGIVDESDYNYLIVDHSHEAKKRLYLPGVGISILTREKIAAMRDTYTRRIQTIKDNTDAKNNVLIIHPEFWLFKDQLDPAMSWLLRYYQWSTEKNSNTDSLMRNGVKFEVLTTEKSSSKQEIRKKGGYSLEWNLYVHLLHDWLDLSPNLEIIWNALSIHDANEMNKTLPLLCEKLLQFDVIMYKDRMFISRNKDTRNVFEVILHLAWVMKIPTIRIFDESMGNNDPNSHRLYATGFLLTSTVFMSQVDIALEIANDQDLASLLPPLLPPSQVLPLLELARTTSHVRQGKWKHDDGRTVTILYAGGMVPTRCPSSFVRIAALLNRMQGDSNKYNLYEGSDSDIRFKFLILDYGYIGDPIKLLIEAYQDLRSHVSYIPMEKGFTLDVLEGVTRQLSKSVDIVLDPCPSDGGNSVIYPLAAALGIHIVQFNSSSSKEWILENQKVTFVTPSTTEKMAEIIFSVASSSIQLDDDQDDIRKLALDAFDGDLSILTVLDMIKRVLSVKQRQGDHFAIPRMPVSISINTTSKQGMNAQMEVEVDVTGSQPDDYIIDPKVNPKENDLTHSIDECFGADEDSRLNLMIINALKEELTSKLRDVPRSSKRSLRRHRVLCSVFTHKVRHHNVQMQRQTFGLDCDGFISFSDLNDSTINSM